MGLITQEIEITLNNKYVSYYKNLGYEIPQHKDLNGRIVMPRGSKIIVKAKDLPDTSPVEVKVRCDGCSQERYIKWREYKRYVHNDGKYYCRRCAANGFKKWTSFKEWCIQNNRQDILDRWDYELNNCTPDDITCFTHNEYWFKCPIGKHKSELKNINNFTAGRKDNMRCIACNSFAQWGINNLCEDFLEKYWDYDKNKINPWEIAYASHSKVWIKCQEKDYHSSYLVNCDSFTLKNTRCPYCDGKKVHILDSLGILHPEVLKIWSNKNKKSPYDYTPNSSKKVWWKCSNGKHKDYLRTIDTSNSRDFRCPQCQYSKGEDRISQYLIQNNINYIAQKTFNDLKGIKGGLLSYDFYLPRYNLLIEYQGEFHDGSGGRNYTRVNLEYQQEHDRRKREYAKSNNINLLEIWYYDFDNIEQILNRELQLNQKMLA